MAWSHVYDYMLEVAPDLRDALVGVPEAHILACEQNWGLELPQAYRSFLATMGVDAGRFSPLSGKEWNFYELLRDLPDPYDPQRFFQIGVDVDDNLITKSEFYLDMATKRADGDCDVIEIEWLCDPATSPPVAPRRTFLERLLVCAWMGLDGCRFAHDRFLLTHENALESIHDVLSRAGFALALPVETQNSVWWSTSGESFATAKCSARAGSTVIVASDDEKLVRRVTQLLLDNVPGAALSRHSPSFFKR